MAATPTTYTGEDAKIWLVASTHSTIGLGDFSITIDRGVVEQELVGEAGNKFQQGAVSIEGSFTNAEWDGTVMDNTVGALINGTLVKISGSAGPNSLHFTFASCQITGFDLTLGDASTVTEGSVDFTVLDPYNIKKTSWYGSGMKISD